MVLERAEILFNDALSQDLYHLGLRCPKVACSIQPGQFLMIRIRSGYDPLLRRPFAVHRLSPPTGFEVLYKAVGRGTRLLAETRRGASLDVLGPLGRGFEIPGGDGPLLMVAGGIGVAPLPFLAETVVKSGRKGPYLLWFGGRTARDLVCVHHFQDLGFVTELVTEDGTAGRKGLVTDYLEEWLPRQKEMPKLIYSCGPYPMQRKVVQLASRLGIAVEVA
ncbi:MAG TPA: dihydroorotate dehydrogenase electron transfer subunit, partial [Syntrophobacteria bacterium]|nr:dihydroorotate dehydrogenase electron transfer subunit [Syntrophobacteria bacterium]